MREKKDLDNDQRQPQNKKSDYFPPRESGQVMPEEKKRETDRRNNSGHGHAGNLEFEICSDDSTEQREAGERAEQLLKTIQGRLCP